MKIMKRLVLFVEGDADVDAVPILVRKILTDLDLWDSVILEKAPFRIGSSYSISGKHKAKWVNHLKSAMKRRDVGGVLVILDGDADDWEGQKPFCASIAARTLVERAKETGAGTTYSLGLVFACLEYESWLLAVVESLAGKRLSDGRSGVLAGTQRYEGDLESAPRGAKEKFNDLLGRVYKETLDQAELTKLVDLAEIRERGMRSFTRLETAIKQLAGACKSGSHLATPPS